MNQKNKILIKNANLVSGGKIWQSDLLIENDFIAQISENINPNAGTKIIDANGKYLIPGIIDDQVHFREPGLTRKANIYSEARAAVSGGVTSFMEMPNTKPPATTLEKLEEKYEIARNTSLANYSFFMGTTNDNAEEVLKVDPKNVCGIKIFMGSSTGNMLVDNEKTLEKIFSESPNLIAIHSEVEGIIKANTEKFKTKYGENIPISAHPEIRSVAACFESTKKAVEIAERTGGRLHVLHISTEEELDFFRNDIPIEQKKITAEVCAHHLFFDAGDYEKLGSLIKCNPAIKESRHKKEIFKAVLDGRIDILASDHAPHTWDEKQKSYLHSPSGLPLVAHTLNIMLDFYHNGNISLEKIVEKMCHDPARLFRIEKRGYLREGYFADLALIDLDERWEVNKSNIYYKCAWSPFEGYNFRGRVTDTFVSGHHAFSSGNFDESKKGKRLEFNY
jgi:dihydroorotase